MSKEIELLPGNGKVSLRIDHPHFGIIEVDRFQRPISEINKYFKGGLVMLMGNFYRISQEPVILTPSDVGYYFALLVIQDTPI